MNINKSTYRWAVVAMLWLICFLNYADRQAIFSIFPVLEKNFSFSKWQLGLLGSAFLWVYASSALVAGFCVDRWSRKFFILGGCFFWSLVTMGTGLCTQCWQFVGVRSLEGLGESFYFPASSSLLADYHGGKTRSLSFALHLSGITAGMIAGSSLGGWFAQYYQWQYGFYFFGVMGLLVVGVLFLFLKEPRRGGLEQSLTTLAATPHEALKLRELLPYLLKKPLYLLQLGTWSGVSFVNALFTVWMPLFLYEKFHCSLTVAGFSGVTFIQTAAMLMTFCSGWYSDRIARHRKRNRLLLQAGSLLLGALAIMSMGRVASFVAFIAAMIAYGMCKGSYDGGGIAAIFDQIEPKVRGSALGVMVTLGALGGALGPMVVGAFSRVGKSGFTAAISLSAAVYLCCGVVTLMTFVLAEKKRNG
ncbi:MAG: MFS transporter [Chthoniobacterales bacterium]|nr:MFS transporter [Chthoniobacterales bacterium]